MPPDPEGEMPVRLAVSRRAAAPFVLAALLAGACAHPAARAQPEVRPDAPVGRAPLHHDLVVTLAPGERRIAVEDTVALSPDLRARAGERLVFSLHAGLAPERVGGAPLERASAPDGPDENTPVPLERWAVTLRPGERQLTIRYAGEIFHPVVQRGREYARGMSESPGLVSGEGVFLTGETRWVPELDGEERVAFALEARVPAGWDAVSQGARTRHERGARETVARWESPEPQEGVVLVAGPLVERSRTGGRVALQTFLRSDDPALADVYLDAGERYLATYEALLGPYPYAKFAVVENFWETGYGMPSFTLLGSRVIRLPFLVQSSYPHEILHNWWGNGVYVDPEDGNWSEGLTAYLADHLVQEQRGQGAEYRRAALQRFADSVAEDEDFPVRAFRERHDAITQAVGYDKVLMVFHMLRRRMGDARFVAGLRRFYEEERFRAASFSDLGRTMSAAAGEDLAPWLAQWLDRPGAPALRLESARAIARAGDHVLELTLAQTQGGPPFEVDVPVAVTLASGEAVRRTVRLDEARERLSIPLEGVPVRVDVDPELDVFRRLDPAELPPALSGAFGASEAVFVLPAAAPDDLSRAYRDVAERWSGEGTRIVTDAELGSVPAGRAVWIFGWENRLRDAVAAGLDAYGVALAGDALRAEAVALSRERHAVVAAVRSPADPAQVAVFVGAPRAAPLAGLARKLPHYGKYGLLGFEGDEPANVAKRSWPVLRSPLAAALGPAERLPERGDLPPREPLVLPR